MTDTPDKIRIAMEELTLGEMAEVGELLGTSLDVALTGPRQPLAVAALAWVTQRRSDPSFTFEDAQKLRIADVDLVTSEASEDTSGEALAANNGGSPLTSLESGDSILSPS